MTTIWLEIKSACSSFRFFTIIFVLLLFQAILFTQFTDLAPVAESNEQRINNVYYRTSKGMANYWQHHYDYYQEHQQPHPTFMYPLPLVEADLAWYRHEEKLADSIQQAYQQENWQGYHQKKAEKLVLEWNILAMLTDKRNPYVPYQHPEDYFGGNWESLSKLIEPFEFEQLPLYVGERRGIISSPEQVVFSTALHLNLLQNDLPPARPHGTEPWTFIFNFLRSGLPLLLGLVVLLMTVNLIHQDKKFGSIKTSLQHPRSRSFYLLRKVTVGFVTSLFAVIIPQLVVLVILGIRQGFGGLNLPVLLSKNFMDWTHSVEHIHLLKWTPEFNQAGLSQYPPSYSGWHAIETVEFIPLWQFLLFSMLALTLFVLFCSVLGVLISALIRNEILAQAVAVATFILGNLFGRIFPDLTTTSWDFFSKANTVALLEGTHFTSYLNSLVTMGLATVVLFGLSFWAFRKQDIVS